MQRATMWFFGACFFALICSLPNAAHAACIELKNDNFVEGQSTGVVAVRSFCISEYYGTVFKAEKDLTIQKIRILISGDGKNIMQTTTLKMRILKEKAPGSAEPGEVISGEVPYQPKSKFKPTPEWMEITDATFGVKKGESFRVVFGHGNIDCELRVTGKPLCAEPCSWWSATVDGGPIKPNVNVVEGSRITCPEVKDRKWRFWKDLPESCRPKGNLIVRVLAYDGVGKDCKGGGTPNQCQDNETKPCTCTDGKTGAQVCKNGAWEACKCEGTEPPKTCTPGATQKCVCTKGEGVQSCKNDGSGWEACKCEGTEPPKTCTPGTTQACKCGEEDGQETCKSDGSGWDACKCETKEPPKTGKPEVEKITPSEGIVGKNTEVTIIGKNFVDGAKVTIGNTEALNVKVVGPTTITAVVPAEVVVGTYNITVTNPDGAANSLLEGFVVNTPPGCHSIAGQTPTKIPFALVLWLMFFAWWGFQRNQQRKQNTQ